MGLGFNLKIVPRSKLRSYKIIRKISPALVEVMEVNERGKPKLVNMDVLKEFRGDNSE